MLSKSSARKFFLIGTVLCAGTFILLTVDTVQRVPAQTNQQNITESVIRGKHLWDSNNCMGCHTIMGEGAYYAPELTKVYERRGPLFIKQMLTDPEAMYPGQRKMVKYPFTDTDREDLVSFLKWIGEIDLNGFPAKPDMAPVSAPAAALTKTGAAHVSRPAVFEQVCAACHSIGGQGGSVGPALDDVGARRDREYLVNWLKDPSAVKPGAKMPKLPLSGEDINSLATYLSAMKGR